MRLLLSNDDGVHAPGLKILADCLSTLGEVTVVAPDRDRSGASNSLTLTTPLRVSQLSNGYYRVEGTPTDCVHLALTGLLPFTPDIVVSGINNSANLGDDVIYSGTVAAAMEGRSLGFPAIAVSLCSVAHNAMHYATAAEVVRQLIDSWRSAPMRQEAPMILNVNVPDVPLAQLKGLKPCRLGARHPAQNCVKSQDPRGQAVYWIGPAGGEEDAGPGTDFAAVREQYAAVTPLHVDLTRHASLAPLGQWLSQVA
jgi:5'-nucleotidase